MPPAVITHIGLPPMTWHLYAGNTHGWGVVPLVEHTRCWVCVQLAHEHKYSLTTLLMEDETHPATLHFTAHCSVFSVMFAV